MSDRHDCGSKSSHKCLVCEVSRLFQVSACAMAHFQSCPNEQRYGKDGKRTQLIGSGFFLAVTGVLFGLTFAVVAAPFAAFNLESCKAFGRIRAAGCARVFYCHAGCAASALCQGQVGAREQEQQFECIGWQFEFQCQFNGHTLLWPMQLHYRSNLYLSFV